MTKILFIFLLVLSCFCGTFAQTILHSENFSSGLNGYTRSAISSVATSTGSPSNNYLFASGGRNVSFLNNFTGSDTLYSPVISTVGFETIRILFGHRRSGATLSRSLLFFNGINWVAGPSIPEPAISWSSSDTLSFGTAASLNANFRFAIVVTATSTATQSLRFDDFQILGDAAALSTVYYSKSSGALNELSTWGTNTDGSGSSPVDFNMDDITYVVTNNPAPTLTAPWLISGLGSKIVVRNGSNLTVPSLFSLSALVDIDAGGVVTLNNDTTFSIIFNTLAPTSTVIYNASNVRSAIYGNLVINQPASIVSIDDSVGVRGVLSIQEGDLNIGNAALNIGAGGSINYGSASFLRGGILSRVFIQTGSSSAGELRFRDGFDTIQQLIVSGTASLASDLAITSNCIFNSGSYVFTIGANTISSIGFTGSGTSNIVTSSSSSLIITGTTTTYILPTAISTLNNFTINRPNGQVRQSGSLTVHGTLSVIAGFFNPLTNTLTIKDSIITSFPSGQVVFSSSTVVYDKPSAGQNVIAITYGSLIINNHDKVFSPGNFNINFSFDGGTSRGHTTTGTTINFRNTGLQSIPGFNYNAVRFQGNGSIKSVQGPFSATGLLTIDAGVTLQTNDHSITLSSGFTNNGTLQAGNSEFVFNGTADQVIRGNNTLSTLTIRNNNPTAVSVNTATTDTLNIIHLLSIAPGAGQFRTRNKVTLLDGATLLDSASNAISNGSINGNLRLIRQAPTTPLTWSHVSTPLISANSSVEILKTGGFAGRRYDENDPGNVTNFNAGFKNVSSGLMTVARGYATYQATEMIFVGQVNNGNQSFPVTRTVPLNGNSGWNLVGNPYPSAIRIADFFAANNNGTNLDGSFIYIWNTTTQNYITYSALSVTNEVIPSMQGFFVQATTSDTLVFNNAMRTATNTDLLRTAPQQTNTLTVFLEGPNGWSDKTEILTHKNATIGKDQAFDATKLPGISGVSIATHLKGYGSLAIQGVPEIKQSLIIPLDVEAQHSGRYTFSHSGISGVKVYLEDLFLGTVQPLDDAYSIDIPSHDPAKIRFQLHLLPLDDASLDDRIEGQESNPYLWQSAIRQFELVANGFKLSNFNIQVVTLQGRIVYADRVSASPERYTLNLQTLSAGPYIVLLQNELQRKSLKLIIE